MAELTLVKSDCLDDWYMIELAEHNHEQWLENIGPNVQSLCDSGRISDACVEGTSEEMLDIAKAIRDRTSASHRRCAVRVYEDQVAFESPRNSSQPGFCSLEEADSLAAKIEEQLGSTDTNV